MTYEKDNKTNETIDKSTDENTTSSHIYIFITPSAWSVVIASSRDYDTDETKWWSNIRRNWFGIVWVIKSWMFIDLTHLFHRLQDKRWLFQYQKRIRQLNKSLEDTSFVSINVLTVGIKSHHKRSYIINHYRLAWSITNPLPNDNLPRTVEPNIAKTCWTPIKRHWNIGGRSSM